MPSELRSQGDNKLINTQAFVLFLLETTSSGMGQLMVGKMHGHWGVELMLSWDQWLCAVRHGRQTNTS